VACLIGDRDRCSLYLDREFRIGERQQHLVVDLVTQRAGEPFQHRKIEHVPAVGVDRALDGDTHPIVVAVQRLAAMSGERDEMGR